MKAGVYEVDAREAECHMMAGRPEEALKLADATLARVNDDVGIELLAPMLHRTRGYALAQRGDLMGARAAFEESLRLARERDASYEEALAMQGLARLDRAEGRPPGSALDGGSGEIFDRLGVIATPAYPMHEAPS
jgi:hypothetical protein